MSIAHRLTIAFLSVSVVIGCGAIVTSSQFLAVLRQAGTIKIIDEQVVSVYRVRSDVGEMRRRLDRLAQMRDLGAFKTVIQSMWKPLSEDIEVAIRKFEGAGTPVPASLGALSDTLGTQFDAMERLADVGDWTAVQLRFTNQFDRILDDVKNMVNTVSSDVDTRRSGLLSELERNQRRAQLVLMLTALSSLLVAAGFGLYLTQTIVKPLAELKVAANQLARGDFNIQVNVQTKDELGDVSRAFVTAASKLSDYYAALKFSNESLEQFAYAASHDLQEPIRTISLLSELIQSRYANSLPLEGKEDLSHVVTAAKRMRELVAGILEYSRFASSTDKYDETVDLNHVVKVVTENLHATVCETCAAITCDPLPHVCGNRLQLTQVFQNLIGNALKYRGEHPPRVHVSVAMDTGMLRFCIEDNGIGIDPVFHNQIFGIFKQLERRGQGGAGIGLAITKRMIEKHGGSIWVESSPGSGSRFFFTLKPAYIKPLPTGTNQKRSVHIPART